jgi:SAM-dependent methyltransferase
VTFSILTDHPVALTSPDHLQPWGTARDNSINPRFNAKLRQLVGRSGRSLSVLDLGCSGGGMVRSFLDEGVMAVGVEGSDYSKLRGRAEWATIPEFLFTADVTKPFQIMLDGVPQRFSAVTAWEFLEHVAEEDLAPVFDNIGRHLTPGGYVVASVSHDEEVIEGVVLHQTVQPRAWWDRKFEAMGWCNDLPLVGWFGPHVVRDCDNSTIYVLRRA